MRIGFTCGSYDLLHAGHILSLQEARNQCDKLVVGLQSDPTLDRKEKNSPVQSIDERLIQLEAVRYVDSVVVYHTEKDLFNLLSKQLNIDVRFLGNDWVDKVFTGKGLPMDYVFQSRDHGYSSSELRRRVGIAEFENIHKEWVDVIKGK